jgi:hypothetical protein
MFLFSLSEAYSLSVERFLLAPQDLEAGRAIVAEQAGQNKLLDIHPCVVGYAWRLCKKVNNAIQE